MDENVNYTPTEYFNMVKERKHKATDKDLNDFYNNCLLLLNKYKTTGQVEACKKMLFFIDVIEKEMQLVKMGIDTFVYKEDIENYIDNIASNVVKIIELKNYEREIPDELVDVICKTEHIFDQFFIVFTDYTGREERKVEKKRREKDPILFGAFENKEMRLLTDRFYYLGDWVDEYCDLTLSKMISESRKNIEQDIVIPNNLEQIKEEIYRMEHKEDSPRRGIFSKIKSKLKRR